MSTPNHTGGIDLEGAVELWQTPSVADVMGGHLTRGGERKEELLLKGQVKAFPSPAGRDYRSPNLKSFKDRGGADEGRAATEFHRALFPPGPSDREQWATIIAERPDLAPAVEYEVRRVADGTSGGMDFARADQLRGLGNMVVPMQGALALLVLLRRTQEQ